MPRFKHKQDVQAIDTADPLHRTIEEMTAEEVIELMRKDPEYSKPTSSASIETEAEGVRHEALRRARVRRLGNATPGSKKPAGE